jgi:uncharacterized GH25 family protein
MVMRLLLLIVLSVLLNDLFSQDIWLRPGKYFYEPGDTAIVQFATGEDFIARPWLPAPAEIEFLEHLNKLGTSNIKDSVKANERTPLKIGPLQEGYQFVVFKTKRSLNVTADQFNNFLKQYGSDEIYTERKKNNRLNEGASISAENVIQLAFRVGKNEGQGWNEIQGLPVEVIPDKNPQTLKRGDRIYFTVYENGKPAFGVRVRIWNRWDKRTTIQNIYTEKDGTVSTTISNPGDWMVTVMKLGKTENGNAYDANVFSLNFGYR